MKLVGRAGELDRRGPAVKGWREQIDSDQLFLSALLLCPVWGVIAALIAFSFTGAAEIAFVVGIATVVVSGAAVVRWKENAVIVLRAFLGLLGP